MKFFFQNQINLFLDALILYFFFLNNKKKIRGDLSNSSFPNA